MAGSREHEIQVLGSTKGEEFLDKLRVFQLHRKYFLTECRLRLSGQCLYFVLERSCVRFSARSVTLTQVFLSISRRMPG